MINKDFSFWEIGFPSFMGGSLEYCFRRQPLNPKYFDRSSIKKENVRIEGRKNMIFHGSIREKMQKNAKKKKIYKKILCSPA